MWKFKFWQAAGGVWGVFLLLVLAAAIVVTAFALAAALTGCACAAEPPAVTAPANDAPLSINLRDSCVENDAQLQKSETVFLTCTLSRQDVAVREVLVEIARADWYAHGPPMWRRYARPAGSSR